MYLDLYHIIENHKVMRTPHHVPSTCLDQYLVRQSILFYTEQKQANFVTVGR